MANWEITKLQDESTDIIAWNIEKIWELFPNVIVESENGKSIDFDALKQELSHDIIDWNKERFQLVRPWKKDAIANANAISNNTLRPVDQESIDFDNTKNIYIEWDNLEALKILQESYLRAIKMIYIDPPYNTGNDFVYNDTFYKKSKQELLDAWIIDSEWNILVSEIINTEGNSRFHSDWLSMMYPRLKLARNLLAKDWVIFISIDDNELANLKKLCDEIFWGSNFLTNLVRNKQHSQQQWIFKRYHESVLVYARDITNIGNISWWEWIIDAWAQKKISKKNPASTFTFPAGVRFDAKDWTEITWTYWDSEKSTITEWRLVAKDWKTLEPVTISAWWTQKNQMYAYFSWKEAIDSKWQKVLEFYFTSTWKLKCIKDRSKITPPSILPLYWMVSEQTDYLTSLLWWNYFDNPKPVQMLYDFCSWFLDKNDIVLDFFSWSATTAESLMRLNASDWLNRKYILVQLPELCSEDSEAYKAGYKNICEIWKYRIKKAWEKIKEETNADIDYWFRVYKIDSSNYNEDINKAPGDLDQSSLFNSITNLKIDRTPEDLLTWVILHNFQWKLDLKIEERKVWDNNFFFVEDNALLACFDNKINLDIIEELATYEPLKVVFKDSAFTDQDKINLSEKFKRYSPNTEILVL